MEPPGGLPRNFDKILVEALLARVPSAASEHHLGRPFLTAYQIAIEFARLYPDETKEIGYPIGGVGIGQRNSLSQYLALQLSRNIGAEKLEEIEGGFVSNQHLNDISFNANGEIIHSSLTGTNFTLSLYRLKAGY